MLTFWEKALLILVTLFLLMLPHLAHAQGTVEVPWGDWLVQIMNVLLPTVLTALAGVSTYIIGNYVPQWVRAVGGSALQSRVNQVLEKAVLSAVAQTKGAVMGQRLSIPIGIEVLRKAAQYAVDQAPDLMKAATKEEIDNLLKMILARMEQWGVAPKELDVNKVNKQGFDFKSEISKQLGK